MRLKKQHDGYSSYGLWLKYQTPEDRRSRAGKKRKKPCDHEWHRYHRMKWNRQTDEYDLQVFDIICAKCDEEKNPKSAKTLKAIDHPYIEQKSESVFIQIRINGEYLPLPRYVTRPRSEDGFQWCYECCCYH